MRIFTFLFALPMMAILVNACAEERSSEDTKQDAANEQTQTSAENAAGESREAPPASAETTEGGPKADAPEVGGPDPLASLYGSKINTPQPLLSDFRKEIFTNIGTYSGGLEDAEVKPSQVQPWSASPSAYAGAYMGPLDGEYREMDISFKTRDNYPNYLAATISYQREQASATGMMEMVKGDEEIPYTKVNGTSIAWAESEAIDASRGQFVKWTTVDGDQQRGILLFDDEAASNQYTLMRRMN